MTIEILPARLANQIAAGEVVERPASVVKELVENSLDAGATVIKIDIEKGGAKRIKISDNGSGIIKDELTLALSRHATSKIKNLTDLEGIASLGFRGEALASISSVARLTLTSKPASQENAWQACAQGRDMDVVVQPAAHSDGTTIDVVDLFFNTPARRKFLRTEKTEFSHIDEVIKRIALARFDVAFTLTHNGKVIRQYRAAKEPAQYSKRVAQVCGQAFIDNALYFDCQHESLHLHGWLAQPTYCRSQNDLCYSYVNGRMMRDKLINHAIRQAYSDLLPSDTYPAFVLFLDLDVRDVDVNVHPAKHEVRFHQSRYVHDFIYAVCQQTLNEQPQEIDESLAIDEASQYSARIADYVTPVRQISEPTASAYQGSNVGQSRGYATNHFTNRVNQQAANNYQQLMTPALSIDKQGKSECPPTLSESSGNEMLASRIPSQAEATWLTFVEPGYGVILLAGKLKLVSLISLAQQLALQQLVEQWQAGLTSQPLLLPIVLKLDEAMMQFFITQQSQYSHIGIIAEQRSKQELQIRQFPAVLRHQDVQSSFISLTESLMKLAQQQTELTNSDWQEQMAVLIAQQTFTEESATSLWQKYGQINSGNLVEQLGLNSVDVDLTSTIKQLS